MFRQSPHYVDHYYKQYLAHFDADLYSSTVCALEFVTPLLGTGSLLLFDELSGAGGAEQRAFEERLTDAEADAALGWVVRMIGQIRAVRSRPMALILRPWKAPPAAGSTAIPTKTEPEEVDAISLSRSARL